VVQVDEYLNIVERYKNVAFVVLDEHLPEPILFFCVMVGIISEEVIVEFVDFLFVIIEPKDFVLVAS
jgi:hypothetical protein